MANRRTALTGAAALLLGGCGFHLRQPPKLPFQSIALTGFARRSSLEQDFRRQLERQVSVQESPEKAELVLQALEDLRQKSVVASTSAAQVREVQLRLKFSFRVATPGGRELVPRAELLLVRDINYSETQALAKEAEEGELYREMQADVVAQVLRRLAAVHV